MGLAGQAANFMNASTSAKQRALSLKRKAALAAPHPNQPLDGAGSAVQESLSGVGPMNAHPRPLGMGRHMGGSGVASDPTSATSRWIAW